MGQNQSLQPQNKTLRSQRVEPDSFTPLPDEFLHLPEAGARCDSATPEPTATGDAILEALGSESAHTSTTEHPPSQPQPQPSTVPMFFLSAQEAQQRLSALFQHWHPNQPPPAIAQYYAQTLGIELITVERIEKLLNGKTLLTDIEYGCFCTNKLNLRQENGDRLTPQELRWFCQTAWGDSSSPTTSEPPPSDSQDHPDTSDSLGGS